MAVAASARPVSRGRRVLYRSRVLLRNPTVLLGLVLSAALLYLVIAPLVSVVSDAGRVQYGDEARSGQGAGSWTSYYLWRVFRSPVSRLLFWEPLLHTLTVAVGVIAFALVVGGSMAWLVTRTNVPGRTFLA
ncbi:hypothetical protein ACFQY7_07380 [Actinomadura luteofluorescens]